MPDAREGMRLLQQALHELETVIREDSVTSIIITRTDTPTPMFKVIAYTEGRMRGPYEVPEPDVRRVLAIAELEETVPLLSIGKGASVRYDRKLR